MEGEPIADPQQSSTSINPNLPPEPQASTSWANVDKPSIGPHSELHQLEQILIDVAAQFYSAREPETATEGEPIADPQQSSTSINPILPPEPQAPTSWANVDQPSIGPHSSIGSRSMGK